MKLASLQARSVAIERMLREHEAHAAKTEIRASFMQGLDAAQRALVQRMPQQASRYYQTLLKRGVDKQVPHALACRENPFTEYGNRGAYLAFELLLSEGGFNRVSLTHHLARELGWARNSAASQAAMIWHAFLALGIIVAQDDRNWAVLAPSGAGHNCCEGNNEHREAVTL